MGYSRVDVRDGGGGDDDDDYDDDNDKWWWWRWDAVMQCNKVFFSPNRFVYYQHSEADAYNE